MKSLVAGAVAVALAALTPASATQDSRRDARLQPERVMDAIGIRPGMVIGEAGAGRGYFTFKLARRVGASGKVYANDIDRAALDHVRQVCRDENIRNVETVVGDIEDPLFPASGLQVVVMVYALHDFARPVAFLESLKKYLDPGGVVAVLDQDPDVTGDRHFLPRERLVALFAESGYDLAADERFLEKDLLLVFRRSAASRTGSGLNTPCTAPRSG
ncbi:MAG TPA: methyltransferase domain-containing protein [Vicinamibacteria bacterium]|nr:methyltransferase domain-containing protein [Vicinamibacteria bacterium]